MIILSTFLFKFILLFYLTYNPTRALRPCVRLPPPSTPTTSGKNPRKILKSRYIYLAQTLYIYKPHPYNSSPLLPVPYFYIPTVPTSICIILQYITDKLNPVMYTYPT
ncbi:hypothetical protein D307_gp054 [Bacillus phage Bastille]|uniref:Uncharacterized protein n=1 Tax=Bacillus phage Bastille TaxID=57477 RepID=J9PLU5_9CAUD|nr:hypothetical protein D307_gp054 [Bacillus phage Bastille]AEQ34410.1 hypothetical protein [Bacillus phage Bastille]